MLKLSQEHVLTLNVFYLIFVTLGWSIAVGMGADDTGDGGDMTPQDS